MVVTPVFIALVCLIVAVAMVTGVYMIERGVARLSAAMSARRLKAGGPGLR